MHEFILILIRHGFQQAKIMRELEEALLEQEVILHAAATSMAELDAAMSLASVASDFGFVRPEVCLNRQTYLMPQPRLAGSAGSQS